MKDILNNNMNGILMTIVIMSLISAFTTAYINLNNTSLKMAELGYVEVQGLGTNNILWVKDTK